MKIYTKQGDEGNTRLGNGVQTTKDSLAIEAIGSVDELNAVLGVEISHNKTKLLSAIQGHLFQIGADLCLSKASYTTVDDDIKLLEERIDFFTGFLTPLKNFILPGGTRSSAWLHYARTVCRRAERNVVSYYNDLEKQQVPCNKKIIIYLNRLSDLLFTMARYYNDNGSMDVIWTQK